jgi:hypothetical protein
MIALALTSVILAVLSIVFRRWIAVMIFWVPGLLLSAMTFMFAVPRLPQMGPGPGGGAEGVSALALIFLALIGLSCITAMVIWRPEEDGWNGRAAFSSSVITAVVVLGVVAAWYYATSVIVHVHVTGPQGRPLPLVRVEYRGSTGADAFDLTRLSFSGETSTEPAGTATIRVFGFADASFHLSHADFDVARHLAIHRDSRGRTSVSVTDELLGHDSRGSQYSLQRPYLDFESSGRRITLRVRFDIPPRAGAAEAEPPPGKR